MKLCGIEIGGMSVSGFETSITLPEMGISLDCGSGSEQARQCQTVLITHGHLDHFGGIVRHAYIRHMTDMSPSVFVVPPFLESAVHEQFAFWAKVQNAEKADYKVVVAEPGQTVWVAPNRFVRSFRTIHRVPSQGYTIGEVRKRLKPEFAGVAGPELGRLRREGVEIETKDEVLQVAFTGDTVAKVFDRDLEALRVKVLISECTFLGSSVTPQEARRKGHVHMSELVERADRFEHVGALLLAHFSTRHTHRDITAALQDFPPSLREKTHFLK